MAWAIWVSKTYRTIVTKKVGSEESPFFNAKAVVQLYSSTMRFCKKCTSGSGFTLIELSIVLVIIGLIVGGILVGRELIHAAEIRAYVSQIQKYDAAVQTFQGKYNCLPGDCDHATKFWPQVTGSCDNNYYAYTTDTCNGDGDGAIANNQAWPYGNKEVHRFWQHLASAGLIEGRYLGESGYSSLCGATACEGVNAPGIKLRPGAVILVLHADSYTNMDQGHGEAISIANKHVFTLSVSNQYGYINFLSPNEARSIDEKFDDGLPSTGNAQSILYNACANNAGGQYTYRSSDAVIQDFSSSGAGCILGVGMSF